MASGSYRFDRFVLDPADRQLRREGAPVELNARYLDALALLVREAGKLVSKDRFLEEVWQGVPVTDEALTQCIKTLRRQLGDDAGKPRFIETVPKHGYRFIAPVESADEAAAQPASIPSAPEPGTYTWREFLLLGGMGTVGAGLAGVIGGLLYGFAGASQPLGPGMGTTSVLLVLLCLTIVAALIGGAGVSFGIAAAGFFRSPLLVIPAGALSGLVVGAVVKLLGLDAFNLLFGQSPGDITGGAEGALLGAAIGLAAWLCARAPLSRPLRQSVLVAATAGGAAGLLIPLLGGRLMGGSLDLLARAFPSSQLRLDQISGIFGERDFGLLSQVVTAGMEGALFGGCVIGAMVLTRRTLSAEPQPANRSTTSASGAMAAISSER